MLYFRYPFSDQIYTNDNKVALKPVRFVSFDQLENIDFQGNIKSVSLAEFLENEISSNIIPSKLTDYKEESEKDYLNKIDEVIDFIKKNGLRGFY